MENSIYQVDKPYPELVGASFSPETIAILRNLYASRISEFTAIANYTYQARVLGEHNPDVVKACVEGLEEFGIIYDDSHIDDEMYEGIVSTPESKIKMFVIATNEEVIIAKEAMRLAK